MSYPILYSATETSFDHNGLGILGDCVSCEVTEEANGIFELAMRYPMDGLHFAEIGDRAIIKAKADQFRDPQLFRVYAISKPMSGIVTVLAEHISYDLSGIPVRPFSASSVASALSELKNNAVVDCPFDFWTDKLTESNFSVSVPSSIRSTLGGSAGSIISVYGGDLEFDNYTVKLHNNRGMNRGVSIRYGKNLTDIKQEENCSSVATGVYPYWYFETDEGGALVELPEKVISAPGTYDFTKIRTVDFSQEFEVQPTEEQLRKRAEKYIADNKIGVPKVSLTISFAQLDQTQEYKHMKLLERVSLFDTVNVEFTELGVSAVASAVKMVYDVLSDRVKSVTLGSARANIADTIASQQQEIQQAPTKSDLEKAKEAATAWLTNGKGYAYFRKDDLGNIVDILFMDTQDMSTAVNVMRVGQSGIGFSHNGVNGPYESAWTIDGEFVADWIKSGTLDANLVNVINLVANNITSGKISSSDGGTYFDLDSGAIVSQTSESKLIFYGSSLRLNHGNTTRLRIGVGSGDEMSSIIFANENGENALIIATATDPTTGKDYIGIGMPNADGSGFVSEWVCWKTFAGVPMITSPDAELSVDLTGEVKNALPIANGGTGATSAADALGKLGARPAVYTYASKNGGDCNSYLDETHLFVFNMSNKPSAFNYGWFDVWRASGSGFSPNGAKPIIVQRFQSWQYPSRAWRTSTDGGATWCEWMYDNPPYNGNVEYTTTERYLDRPVKTKLVNCGTVAKGGILSVPHNCNISVLVRAEIVAGRYSVPYLPNGDINSQYAITGYVSKDSVYVKNGSGNSDYTIYAQIWYTNT